MNSRLVAIARVIVCPRWERLIEALREDRSQPRMLWERQCRDCGHTMAVPQDVMDEVKANPEIRLLCDECVHIDDEPRIGIEQPST
jgi:hypothetical protein